MMYQSRYSKKITLSFVLLLLTCSALFSQEYSAWTNYEKAAKLYAEKGSGEEIIAFCKSAQKQTKDPLLFSRAAFLQSSVLIKNLRFEDAHHVFRDLCSKEKEYPAALIYEAKLRKGRLFLQEGKIEPALMLFREVADQDSNIFFKSEAQFALAWSAANSGSWETCDSLLEEIVIESPKAKNDERMVLLNARRFIANNEPKSAIDLLKNLSNKIALKYLAAAYEQADKQIMAVSIYKKIHDGYPSSPEAEKALFQAAEVFMRAEDWLAALSEYERLLQYYPETELKDAIHFRLGWIHLNMGNFDQALSEFRVKVTNENSSYFKFMEGECLRRMAANDPQKMQTAIGNFNNIVSLDIHSEMAPLAKLKAALTEMEKGDTTNALISLRQFLSLYPKNDLVPAVNFLLAVNENEQNAKTYFNRIVELNGNDDILDAANFALLNQDFLEKNYQKVINRHGMLSEDSLGGNNYWKRASHLLVAESAYFLKHYDLAENEYDLVLNNQEDDLFEKALLGKAWCCFYKDGAENSAELFKSLRTKFSGENQIRAAYGFATSLFHQGKFKEALQEYPGLSSFVNLERLEPIFTKSLYRSAECYYRLQYYTQAIETWDKLVTNFPNSNLAANAYYNLADTYFRANHFAEADSAFLNIIERYSDSPFAVESGLRLGQSAYNSGNYELAVERYQTFMNTYPNHEKTKDALEGIQLSYYQLGQVDQATEVLQKVVDQSKNADLAADAKYQIAVNLVQNENYDEAIVKFKEILTDYPNSTFSVDAQFSLAKSLFAVSNYQEATRELKRFTQYFPNSTYLPEVYYLLGVGFFNLESYLSSIDNFNTILNQFPESEFHPSAVQNIGWCFDKLKEKESALEYFEKYLSLYPDAQDRFTVYLQQARLFKQTNQTEKAVAVFEELKRSEQPQIIAEAAFELGLIYVENKQISEAEAEFKQAIKNGEQENYYRLSAIAQLGAIYENTNQQEQALNMYNLLVSSTDQEQWVNAAKERMNLLAPLLSTKVEK